MKKLRLPKYKIHSMKEDAWFNHMKGIARIISDEVTERLGMNTHLYRYDVNISIGRKTKWIDILATDELDAVKRIPRKIKAHWDVYHDRNRYDRKKR